MYARVSSSVALALVVQLLSASVSAAQTTALALNSQLGDFIGGGISQTFTPTDGAFSTSRNFSNGISVQFNGGPHFWFLDFAAPLGAPLATGVYEGATRWPFESLTAPGLSVSGEGRGCNTLTGRFEVLEVVYGVSGNVERFAATFEQHCEGGVPALVGAILINSTLPGPPLPPTRCAPTIATIPALVAEVDELQRGGAMVFGLRSILLAAQEAVEQDRPRLGRRLIAEFIGHAVANSNVRPGHPHFIPVTAADTLVCGAANVLTNIAVAK